MKDYNLYILKRRRLIFLFGFILFASCHRYDPKIEQVLHLAGDNRQELEKVLWHYASEASDSLKLKAAEFLIGNMPGHYTLVGGPIEKCRKIPGLFYFTTKVLDICAGEYFDGYCGREEDVANIKAEFLIRHIDAMFEWRNQYAWCREVPFDMFLEYILPYRFGNEKIDLWRDSLHLSPDAVKVVNRSEDLKYDPAKVKQELYLSERKSMVSSELSHSLFGEDMNQDCRNIFLADWFEQRAMGLPAVLDFFPFYPNRDGYHYWVTTLSPLNKNTTITGAVSRKAAKVYRRTFSHQSEVKPGKNEYIPEFFRDPFHKDVTDLYFNTQNVTVEIQKKISSDLQYAYLCVFNNLSWQPIAMGELKRHKAVFSNMGKDIVYLPVYYEKEKNDALDVPFVLKMDGHVQRLLPDTMFTIHMRLFRKYPFNKRVDFCMFFEKLCWEASNNADFTPVDTILYLRLNENKFIDEQLNLQHKYRYWRLLGRTLRRHLAEIVFWDEKGKLLKGQTDTLNQPCFDGDPLTCPSVDAKSIVIDFGQPVCISRIVCLPRGDGNGIYPENKYELFYYGKDGWVSLGKKTASDYFIDYFDVPSGALYWLRNLTSGKEERIFTYDNGKVRFW